METALAILVGVGLAASCGFRVFTPLLVASVAASAGYVAPAPGFEWLGTTPALVSLSLATVIEVGAYYVPWIDNLLDSIASPAAVIAGTLLFAAYVTELDPFLKWSLAVIAGGGSAGIVQGGTVAVRLASTSATGGLTNFVVNTLETVAGFFFAILSLIFPILAITLLIFSVIGLWYAGRTVWRRWWRWWRWWRPEPASD